MSCSFEKIENEIMTSELSKNVILTLYGDSNYNLGYFKEIGNLFESMETNPL